MPDLLLATVTEWLAVVDLDEYAYARNGTIAEYLQTVPSHVGRLDIPWKMFGSSGHVSQPAGSVVNNFTKRKAGHHPNVKSIARACAVTSFDIHRLQLKPEYHAAWPFVAGADSGEDLAASEAGLAQLAIHLNHYPIQSREWFMRVKVTRGDVSTSAMENIRDESYFKAYDTNEVVDEELRRKSIAKHVAIRIGKGLRHHQS